MRQGGEKKSGNYRKKQRIRRGNAALYVAADYTERKQNSYHSHHRCANRSAALLHIFHKKRRTIFQGKPAGATGKNSHFHPQQHAIKC